MNLILSITALLLGPIIYALGRRNHVARQILDGFIFITVAGIICVHIIPDALRSEAWRDSVPCTRYRVSCCD